MSEQLKQELEADTDRLETGTVAGSETIGEQEEKPTEGKLEAQEGDESKEEDTVPMGKASLADVVSGIPAPTKEEVEAAEAENAKPVKQKAREKLEALEKRAEEAEDRELYAVAKKYEVLGEKPEELAKSLKTLKSAGGTAYNDMISLLDRNVAMVNNSGVFGEIGKSFSGGTAAVKKSAAEGKIDTIAKGLIEKDPSMPYNMALAKAWEAHPELMAEYEDEAGY